MESEQVVEAEVHKRQCEKDCHYAAVKYVCVKNRVTVNTKKAHIHLRANLDAYSTHRLNQVIETTTSSNSQHLHVT